MTFASDITGIEVDPFVGANKAGNSNLIQFISNIHFDAIKWARVGGTRIYEIRNEIDKRNIDELRKLGELEAGLFQGIFWITGWTVYGAVALSWCKGAELNQVWEGWEQSGFPLLPKTEYERPARFINPELLPKTQSVKEIAKVADNKSLPICAMIVALEDKPLEFDLPEGQLKSAKPQLAAFLKKKMEAQGDKSPELIAVWAKTIEGTEYA